MTLLEYILTRLLGPSSSSRGNGESFWPCPLCDHEKFHTMPDKPRLKHRCRCWSCGFGGDVFDVLKEFFPTEDFGARQDRLEGYKREHAKLTRVKGTEKRPRRGVPKGEALLWALLEDGTVRREDLLEVARKMNKRSSK